MSDDESATYRQEVASIVMSFTYELCEECLGDLADHTIAPDPLGHAHAWCNREPYVPTGDDG